MLRGARAGLVVWIAVTLVFAAALLTVGYETAMHFAGVAIDGPFQLYNALRRIDAGFKPGVGFQYFHGLGIPYLHYWVYRLFGGGLRGSELARETIAPTVYVLAFVAVFRVFTGDWSRAMGLSAAALALSFVLHLTALLFAVNGMLGLRSTLPTLLPIALYLGRTRLVRTVATGLTLGVALFMSTEQGLAALVAYAVVAVIATLRRSERREQVLESAATIALAALMLVVCLVMVGGIAGMRGGLRYNFSLVPMDQYWFFGAPPNAFMPSWSAGLRMAISVWPIGLALLFGMLATGWYTVRFWRGPDGEAGRRNAALATLPLYGLASCGSLLGVFTPAYVEPCWRAVIVVALVELTTLATGAHRALPSGEWLGVPKIVAAASGVCSAWAIATIPLISTAVFGSLPRVIVDRVAGREQFSAAGIWPETLREGQRLIDSHRGPLGESPTLWSTYAGWLEARNGLFNPTFDYMIHALGPENRTAYVDRFRAVHPGLVQTVRPTYTPYESWLENNDWAFYDELLTSYRASSATPWSIFWEPRNTPAPSPRFVGMTTIAPGATSIQLPLVRAGASAEVRALLLVVEVDYDTHNPLAALPIIGASPRYLIGIEGAMSTIPVSLDPYVHRTRFPLVILEGQTPTLRFGTFSLLPGTSWTARAIRVWLRPADASTQLWFSDLVLYLTPSAGK